MEANGSVTKGVGTGVALGATVGVGYAACAPVFRLWPEAGAAFMNFLCGASRNARKQPSSRSTGAVCNRCRLSSRNRDIHRP
jgi:hypothetical protein